MVFMMHYLPLKSLGEKFVSQLLQGKSTSRVEKSMD
jgi:hypothetical protein